jgi:hypothetical protein
MAEHEDLNKLSSEEFLSREDVVPIIMGEQMENGEDSNYHCDECGISIDVISTVLLQAAAHPQAKFFCHAHGREWLVKKGPTIGGIELPPDALQKLGEEAGRPISKSDVSQWLNMQVSTARFKTYIGGYPDGRD